ncbi:MAG: hypothetical protein ACLTZY_02510 [Alistipes indistinctus]
MDNHYWQQEVYVTAANLFAFTPWWTANLSADFQWNKLDADGTDMFNAHFIEPSALYAAGSHSHIGQPQTAIQHAGKPALHICT